MRARADLADAGRREVEQLTTNAKELIKKAGAGDFEKAERMLKRAEALCERPQDNSKLAEVLHQLGKLQLLQGNLATARDSFLGALPLRDANDHRGTAATLNNLGVVYSDLGEYQQSLDCYLQSLPLRRELGEAEYADTMLNIGVTLRHFGQPYQSMKYYEEVLPTYQRIGETQGDWSGLADLLQNIGNFYLDTNGPEEAADKFQESIRLHNKGGEKRSEAIAWDSLGLAFKDLGRYEQALDAHTHAQDLYKEVNDIEGIGIAFTNKGALFEDLGRFEEGLQAYARSLEISDRTKSREDRAFALYGLGRIHQKLHNLPAARSYFQMAIDTLEKLRGTIAMAEARQGFSASKSPVYYSMVSTLAEEGHLEEALKLAERFRMRTMREALVRDVLDLKSILPPELYARRVDLRARLSEIEGKMSSASEKIIESDASPQRKTRLAIDMERSSARHDRLEVENSMVEAELGHYVPHYSLVSGGIDLTDLQSYLAEDTALLEYIFGEGVDPVLLAVATRTGFRVHTLAATGKRLREAVGAYVDVLSRGEQDRFIHSVAGQRLYQTLILPAVPDLQGISKLIISADSALQRLPFEALVESDTATPRFLIEAYQIFYVPSATMLPLLADTDDGEQWKDLLAFAVPSYPGANERSRGNVGDLEPNSLRALDVERLNLTPLPFSRDEVEGAASHAGRGTAVHIGATATKAIFKAADLSAYKIIHLAVHASGDENPANCFLAFYFDPEHDDPEQGLLAMKELATLPMNARLVVLSACETARGTELIGEGVRSLSQTVILNGARSVLASEWRVDDYTTAQFMKEFYKSLSRGASKAAALRSAKLSFLRDSGLSHPRYWAAFVLVGNGLDGVDIRPTTWLTWKRVSYFLPVVVLAIWLFWKLWAAFRRRVEI